MGATGERICIVCHHDFTPITDLKCFDISRFQDANGKNAYCPRCLCYKRPKVKYSGISEYVDWRACHGCMEGLSKYEEYADLAK